MTRLINKGLDVILWIIFPMVILYFFVVMKYDIPVIKWIEPMSVYEPVGDMLKYKSHFVKYLDIPGKITIHLVDEKGNTFTPLIKNEGVRHNKKGETTLIPEIDITAFHPIGKVMMYFTVNYTLELPFYTKNIPARQVVGPFCVRDSCKQVSK